MVGYHVKERVYLKNNEVSIFEGTPSNNCKSKKLENSGVVLSIDDSTPKF